MRDALARSFDVAYVEHPGGAIGKLIRAIRASGFESYDLFVTQKFNPITLAAIAVARLRGKLAHVDWDDWDVGLQSNAVKRLISRVCEWVGPRLASHLSTHNEEILAHARKLRPTLRIDQGFDAALFHPHHDQSLARATWKIPPGVRIIGHLCTFTHGGTLDLDAILKAWSRLLTPQIVFMLIGGGPLEHRIVGKLRDLGLQSRTIITGLLDRDETAKALACLDVLAVHMSDTPSNRARVSLKVIEALACGIPVVGEVVGETKTLVGGHVIEPKGDFALMLESIALGDRPAPVPMAALSWEKTMAPWVEWIGKIGKKHGTHP